jgi:sigma-B regulation protein RsbU (phosphoserine phosphatase)
MDPKPAHVLLIEDNPGDADLVRLRLVEASSDLEVACVSRLSSGLQSLAEKTPAVVLLDLNLPDSHGADTFRTVLKEAPTVPIVVLSGLEDEALATKAVHHGVQDYLVKGSFDSKQLTRAIRYAIERQALLLSLDMSRKQQLQFKDEFLSHVSHELRTPLTSIHQFVTILLDGLAGKISEEQREHLSTILGSANQLLTMIDDLLETTRAESGKLRVEVRCIGIADVVHQAVTMLRATANEKRITLGMKVDSGIPLVSADPERVLQILINLIDNALKFTPADGSVTVKAGLAQKDPDYARVSVVDTGRGVSPESKHLIFERLYQDANSSSNSRKGLGLGLYIVQELVRLQGGRIWVESQLGHGSVFSFTLPLFSLSKLLAPIVKPDGTLPDPLVLITVELTPKTRHSLLRSSSLRQQCMDLLRGCIIPDKDIVLPALSGDKGSEIFMVLASADEHGTHVLLKRISGQFGRAPELQSEIAVKISAHCMTPPRLDAEPPLAQLEQQLADAINQVAVTTLGQPNSEAKTEFALILSEIAAAPEAANQKPTVHDESFK